MKKEIEELKSQLESERSEKIEIESRFSSLQSENLRLRDEKCDIEGILKVKNLNYESLEENLKSAQDENQELLKKIEDLKASSQKLQVRKTLE